MEDFNFALLVTLGVLCIMRFVDFFAPVAAALGDKICRSPDLPRVVVVVPFVGLSIYLPYFNLGVVFSPVSSPSSIVCFVAPLLVRVQKRHPRTGPRGGGPLSGYLTR